MIMKLFYSRGACSLVVRIVLNELNLPFEDMAVDLKTKQTADGENFFAINAKGVVPVVQLNTGEIITENQVILQYLTDTTSNQKLLAPVGDLKRYHTLEWLNFISTELHKLIGSLFHPEAIKAEMTLPMIAKRLDMVNKHLENSPYLMGEAFTLPDAYLFVVLRWTYFLKIDLSPYPHINKFMELIHTRPSVVKSLEQEKLH